MPEPSYGPGPWSTTSAASSTTATGSDNAGIPKPAPEGAAAGVRASRSTPPGAPSSTACESDPEKDGFCHVASRDEKSAVATACPAVRWVARWIAGRPFQSCPEAPTTSGVAAAGADGAGAAGAAVVRAGDEAGPVSVRPLNRSRNPMTVSRLPYRSADARVTSVAICSA